MGGSILTDFRLEGEVGMSKRGEKSSRVEGVVVPCKDVVTMLAGRRSGGREAVISCCGDSGGRPTVTSDTFGWYIPW